MNMKKLILTLLLAVTVLLPSCQNLDDIYRRLDDYESRLTRIETLTDAANRDILALQALIEAQNKKTEHSELETSRRPLRIRPHYE